MSASTVRCHVLNGDVSVVSSLDGRVTNVVCPQFDRFTFNCRTKDNQTGFWGYIAKRSVDKAVGTKGVSCEFVDPNDSPLARGMRHVMGG